jgi:peptidoglycan/LPS O-acetylase OafA/YrhL
LKSPNFQYLPGLDHLRAGAALLVLFYHGLHVLSLMPRAGTADFRTLWVYSRNPFIALIEEGHTAVAMFMVLSGFVLSVGALGRDIQYGPFLKNRALRIYPLFIVVALTGVAAQPTRYSVLAFTQSLLFQANFQGALSADPFSTMFWTVAVEFQFYLAFPFMHRFLECDGARWALSLIALAMLLRAAAVLTGSSTLQEIYYWHIVGRIDQFLLGMLAARVYQRYKSATLPWGWLTLLAVCIMLAAITAFNQLGGWVSLAWWKVVWPTVEGAVWATVIVCYVAFASHVPRWLSVPLSRIGTLSYSMYLLNLACIYALPRLSLYQLGPHPNRQSQFYVAGVVLPVLLACSALAYYAIERPFLQLRVKYLAERSSSPELMLATASPGGAPSAAKGGE